MDYFGFLCLGVFTAAFAMTNWPKAGEPGNGTQGLLALIPLLVSGAVLATVAKFRYSPGLGCFPLGLLIGFMWSRLAPVVDWSNSAAAPKSLLAWAWVVTVCITTAGGLFVAGLALVIHAEAQIATPIQDLVDDLRQARARANAPAASSSAASPAAQASAPASANAASSTTSGSSASNVTSTPASGALHATAGSAAGQQPTHH